ncbi:WD40-repeat-containing domain protein [Achaetomium macrosporum]|uniref:WD40-repeat-containing domain protein n=1 Tax=Achaetomium macrosporum TaxID=79813 RepID=A0AAN7HDM3_9PEZI|nr:WD40-repeat-containing domain protein [Achaetomium macrosporum]
MLPNDHFRRRSPHESHEPNSTPSPVSSPTDSGYGSAATTPSPPRKAAKEHRGPLEPWPHGDGNQSDSDDPFIDSDDESTFKVKVTTSAASPATRQVLEKQEKKPFTLPKRSRLSLAAYSPSTAKLRQRASSSTSLRHLDRFIPARPQGTAPSERFRTSKAPHELTAAEKILRHSGATEDAFVYRRRIVTPLAPEFRSISRAEIAASRNRVGTVLSPLDQNSIEGIETQVGGNVALTTGLGGNAVNNGRGELVRSGTNARLFRATFPTAKPKNDEQLVKYQARLAAALGLDRAQRVLDVGVTVPYDSNNCNKPGYVSTRWDGSQWVNEGPIPKPQRPLGNRTLPTAPFKVLDAPNLRDDFYCSNLAYSPTAQTLAVGLGNLLYGWSETRGVQLLNAGTDADCYLTSLSFSSSEGCKAILAFGRSNKTEKTLCLMSLYDDPDRPFGTPTPRFEEKCRFPVACVSWKPVCTIRPSVNPFNPGIPVKTEDLLVGSEAGEVYYYAVEWPERWEVERDNWKGDVTMLAQISIHSQQICGLAWSRNGEMFGTGANDNLCCLFETSKVVEKPPNGDGGNEAHQAESSAAAYVRTASGTSDAQTEIQVTQAHRARQLGTGDEKHRWVHGAAVKAIAFCPWQDSLVATGGGSNDKCIHFWHTGSGAALASISVSAQVTSLIWSTTRHEIAATFGFAQPDHPIRIAVFSWPDCRQVAAVPWAGEHRALYAIPYPCASPAVPGAERPRSRRRDKRTRSRTAVEGCIMVASSDKSVKFHEVWATGSKAMSVGPGVLGGSAILEFLEDIDRDEMVIR